MGEAGVGEQEGLAGSTACVKTWQLQRALRSWGVGHLWGDCAQQEHLKALEFHFVFWQGGWVGIWGIKNRVSCSPDWP